MTTYLEFAMCLLHIRLIRTFGSSSPVWVLVHLKLSDRTSEAWGLWEWRRGLLSRLVYLLERSWLEQRLMLELVSTSVIFAIVHDFFEAVAMLVLQAMMPSSTTA